MEIQQPNQQPQSEDPFDGKFKDGNLSKANEDEKKVMLAQGKSIILEESKRKGLKVSDKVADKLAGIMLKQMIEKGPGGSDKEFERLMEREIEAERYGFLNDSDDEDFEKHRSVYERLLGGRRKRVIR